MTTAPTLPALELETLQGETVALRDPSAVARLIVVYRHDCPTCEILLPVIERVSRAFHGKRLLTLGVSQSDPDATLDTINEHGLCFPQALDRGLALSRALDLEVVPALLLAAPGGALLARADALDLGRLTAVLTDAARLCGADEDAVRRVVAAFDLPAFRTGSRSRTLDLEV